MEKRGKIYSLFAAMLECPTDRLIEQVNASIALLEILNPLAKGQLVLFRAFCLTNPLAALRDIYLRTFSRTAARCFPAVGHHLFGHDRSRFLFAEKVKEEYHSHVVSPEKHVPDHIAVMLRSLVVQESVEEARELIGCCLIPAIGKMIALLSGDNPYRSVLKAVLLTLQSEDRPASIQPEQFALVH